MNTRRSFLKSAVGACAVPVLPALAAGAVEAPLAGWRYHMSYQQPLACFEVEGQESLFWVACPELWFDSYYWNEHAPAHERGTKAARVSHLRAWDLNRLPASRWPELEQAVREGMEKCGEVYPSSLFPDGVFALFGGARRVMAEPTGVHNKARSICGCPDWSAPAAGMDAPKVRSRWVPGDYPNYAVEVVSARPGWKLYSTTQLLNGLNP